MKLTKKLSRAELNKALERGELNGRPFNQDKYDFLVSAGLVTGEGRIFNSRCMKDKNGNRVLFKKPYFTSPGSRKNGGGRIVKEQNYSPELKNLMDEITQLWLRASEEVKTIVK